VTLLLVYAGPNGSGKSSLRHLGQKADPVDVVIDPDRIARAINPADPRAVDRAAGLETLRIFATTLAARRSMSLETTLAGHSVLSRLQAAKSGGYDVEPRFVALDFVALNIERVQARAASGGHVIAPDDIRRRYARSMDNLPRALLIVDRATLVDNTGRSPRPVMDIIGRRIVRAVPDLPQWLLSLMPALREAGLTE
jgi:predicted ABC-type ATPase